MSRFPSVLLSLARLPIRRNEAVMKKGSRRTATPDLDNRQHIYLECRTALHCPSELANYGLHNKKGKDCMIKYLF